MHPVLLLITAGITLAVAVYEYWLFKVAFPRAMKRPGAKDWTTVSMRSTGAGFLGVLATVTPMILSSNVTALKIAPDDWRGYLLPAPMVLAIGFVFWGIARMSKSRVPSERAAWEKAGAPEGTIFTDWGALNTPPPSANTKRKKRQPCPSCGKPMLVGSHYCVQCAYPLAGSRPPRTLRLGSLWTFMRPILLGPLVLLLFTLFAADVKSGGMLRARFFGTALSAEVVDWCDGPQMPPKLKVRFTNSQGQLRFLYFEARPSEFNEASVGRGIRLYSLDDRGRFFWLRNFLPLDLALVFCVLFFCFIQLMGVRTLIVTRDFLIHGNLCKAKVLGTYVDGAIEYEFETEQGPVVRKRVIGSNMRRPPLGSCFWILEYEKPQRDGTLKPRVLVLSEDLLWKYVP